MRSFLNCIILSLSLFACKSEPKEEIIVSGDNLEEFQEEEVTPQTLPNISPISHATAVITWDTLTIYLDPVGGAKAFSEEKPADLILITDIHGDHMDAGTLEELQLGETKIIAPDAVNKELPEKFSNNIIVLNNDETIEYLGISVEAIPMYNLREEAKQFHPKGRGNGYVLEKNGKRLYIAGDTEDIPEMRNLKNIDIALIPMNLPYTMTEDKAAEAVLDFQPKVVYPYHFRGKEGKLDVEKFKNMVHSENKEIEVILAEWYPEEDQ